MKKNKKKRHTEIFSSSNLQGKLHVLVLKLEHMGVIYGIRLLLNHTLVRLTNNFPSVFRIGGNKF